MLTATQVKTGLALASATAAIAGALLLHPRHSTVPAVADDGMKLDARLVSTKILPGAMDHDIAVTITAPGRSDQTRPPLSLVVVLDRSGSMSGEPIENAKAAAGALVQQLGDGDAFSIVTFSSSDETVVPMGRATRDYKARALAAIQTIGDEGGTCISCGITRGTRELAASPVRGLRRMVLMSDGQANEGVYDRSELAQLASDTAAGGISISTVGVGLEFDEVTMQRLANVGHGSYYFVEDTRNLTAMFSRELGSMAETVATQAVLVVSDPGARIAEAYGYPMQRSGDHVIVPIADLRAGETRKVVLRAHLAPEHTGPWTIAEVDLVWDRVPDGVQRRAITTAEVEVVDDAGEVTASIDGDTVIAVESALSARALEEANAVYDSDGAAAAQQVLELRAAQIGRNQTLDRAAAARLQTLNTGAIDAYRTAPAAKAKKVNSAAAYELAR